MATNGLINPLTVLPIVFYYMLEISSKLENKRDNNNIISKQDKNSWLQYQKYQANIFTENKNKYSGDINKKNKRVELCKKGGSCLW